jgi:hypothetical protein
MSKLARHIAAFVIILVAILGAVSAYNSAPVQKSVTATADVPEELTFILGDADLGTLYPGPGYATVEGTIFSTGIWQTTFIDGTIDGNGHMKKAGSSTHELQAPLQVLVGSRYRDLPPNSGTPNPHRTGLHPGTTPIVTQYQQAFTSGDYAGEYSVLVKWVCSATF